MIIENLELKLIETKLIKTLISLFKLNYIFLNLKHIIKI